MAHAAGKLTEASYEQLRVMRAILRTCRTRRFSVATSNNGDRCDFTRNAYNSLPQPTLPKVPGAPNAPSALESRKAELLPVEYFHVVFTLPEQIARDRLL